MSPLQLTKILMEASYDYASTSIDLPPEVGDFLMEWGTLNVPDEVLVVDPDGGKGRENHPHITVKYGLLTQELPEELKEIAKTVRPFPIYLGVISLFRNPDFDVVKLSVESPALRMLNKRVSEAVPNEDNYPTYNPHVTIAYVEKGSCDHLEGDDPFSKDVPREFIAYGMTYKGPGEEEDAQRVKDMLLFSRTARSEVNVKEAVVGPSVSQINEIERIIAQAAQESNGDVSVFTAMANDELEPYGVYFKKHAHHAYGAPAVAVANGVFLPVPRAYDLRDPRWSAHMGALIYHELVHGHQMSKMDDPDEIEAKTTVWMTPHGRIDQDRYLQQKQEIMAWAASLVDSWRRQGLTSEQMMKRLRQGNWSFGMKYWHSRKTHPQVFNRFVKQATEYIEQLKDDVLTQQESESDPFACVQFPSDPDQVKLFLHGNSSNRRKTRPIL